MKPSRQALAGIATTCLIAAAMLAWPLFGSPPYGFFAPMKWVVAFASGAGAWAAWSVSKALLPLSVLLVASGGVELFGKMRRTDWVPFNWASVILLSLCCVICIVSAARQPSDNAGSNPEDDA